MVLRWKRNETRTKKVSLRNNTFQELMTEGDAFYRCMEVMKKMLKPQDDVLIDVEL